MKTKTRKKTNWRKKKIQEEDYMEINIKEDENEPELTYPYEEVNPLNPPSSASESKPDDEIEVANLNEHENETVFASVHEVMKCVLVWTAIEKLVNKLGNTKDKVECKKLKKELEEERFSNTFLCMQNERVKRDLYWTRVRALEFYQEMIHRGFVFEERPNEAINVSIEDEKSPSSEPRESPRVSRFSAIGCNDLIMPPNSAPKTQAAICQMIKDSFDAAIAAERARQEKVRNDSSRSRPVRGAIDLQRWFEKTESVFKISECAEGKKVKFAAATLEGPSLTWWKTKGATMGLETVNLMPWTEMKQLMTAMFCPIKEVQRMEHKLWNLKVKEYDVVAYTQRFNELALMYPRMIEPERVKVDTYIQGLTDNNKGELTLMLLLPHLFKYNI
nr:hypothetical protein [Tanacetum cinerariifolium]